MDSQAGNTKNKSGTFALYGAISTLLVLTACNRNGMPEGHFEGTLLTRNHEEILQTPVSTDISYDHEGARGTLAVRDSKTGVLTTLSLSHILLGGKKVTINIPDVLSKSEALEKDGDCFVSKDKNVRFCASSDRFLLEIDSDSHEAIYTLSGDRFAAAKDFAMETPADFTLQDAINRSLKASFDSRIEFEHVMQARKTAKAAYLNLLPHLSLSTVLSNLPPSFMSLLGSIGDLAPFLLPTRWFEAREAGLAAKAESDAMILMQADMANQVEGLTYSLQRDLNLKAVYEDLLKQTLDAEKKTQDLESKNKMADGSTDNITMVIQSMQLDLSGLDAIIATDKSAISQAMGFHNPEAVLSVDMGSEALPFEQAKSLDSDALTQIALDRSFELRQIDDLVLAARKAKTATYFNWIDPDGDSNANIGFALSSVVKVQTSGIKELLIEREQIQANIAQQVFQAVTSYNESINALPKLLEYQTLQNRILVRNLEQIAADSDFDTTDVQNAFFNCLDAGVRLETERAGFRVARSLIDRLLLQGYYTALSQKQDGVVPTSTKKKLQ